MHRLAALLLAAALALQALPAAGQKGFNVGYTPYSDPSGFALTKPDVFKAVYLERGAQAFLQPAPAPGSVIVGVLVKAGEAGLTYTYGAVVLTPWGYATLPGAEYIASWGPLVAAWRNGVLETYKATPRGLEMLGSVDLAGILGQFSKVASLQVSGGTVCLAGYATSQGWVIVYASAWDPAGTLEWHRIPWSPARTPVLSACNAYQAGAKALQPLHSSGLAYVDGYILTPAGQPLRVPGSVYTALWATPDSVAVVGYNKSLLVYRLAGGGLEFEAAVAPKGVYPAQGVLLLGAAPNAAALGVAYSLEASASPVIGVAAAYYNLTAGEAAGLGANVSLEPIEARVAGRLVSASPRTGWVVPVGNDVLAVFSVTVYWALEGAPGIMPLNAFLAAYITRDGGAAAALKEEAYASSAAGNGVVAAASLYAIPFQSGVILVSGDFKAWAGLLDEARDPPAFIPVMAAAGPGGGWAAVYRVDGPGIPAGVYAIGRPEGAAGVVYAETSLGPAPQASPAATLPEGLPAPPGPVKAVALPGGSLEVPGIPGCTGGALLLARGAGEAAGMELMEGVEAGLEGGLAEPRTPLEGQPALLAVECPGVESSQPWVPAGVVVELDVDRAGVAYEASLTLARLPDGRTAALITWLSGSPPRGASLWLSCTGWQGSLPLPGPGGSHATIIPADCTRGYAITAPEGVMVYVRVVEASTARAGSLQVAWAAGAPILAGATPQEQQAQNPGPQTPPQETTPTPAEASWTWHAAAAAASAAITSLACIATSRRGGPVNAN